MRISDWSSDVCSSPMPRAKACANTSAAIRRPSCPRTCARCWRSDQTPVILHTPATAATHAVEVKHSRFLAHAVPVEDADAALQALAEVSVPDATHNCWRSEEHTSELQSLM